MEMFDDTGSLHSIKKVGKDDAYTLGKEERLYAQKRIDALFAQGQSFISYPLRVVYIQKEHSNITPLVSILASVSKKRFRKAVKRNRVKRLIKEAYRLNKKGFTTLALSCGTSFDIAFLYLKNELPDYTEIEKAMLKTITLLSDKCRKEKEKE